MENFEVGDCFKYFNQNGDMGEGIVLSKSTDIDTGEDTYIVERYINDSFEVKTTDMISDMVVAEKVVNTHFMTLPEISQALVDMAGTVKFEYYVTHGEGEYYEEDGEAIILKNGNKYFKIAVNPRKLVVSKSARGPAGTNIDYIYCRQYAGDTNMAKWLGGKGYYRVYRDGSEIVPYILTLDRFKEMFPKAAHMDGTITGVELGCNCVIFDFEEMISRLCLGNGILYKGGDSACFTGKREDLLEVFTG